jgi:nicotinamidase-related amidase
MLILQKRNFPAMRKTILLLVIFFSIAGLLQAQDKKASQETKQSPDDIPKTALVLIDIQAFYFDTTKAPLVGRYEASEKSAAILKHFRETGQEVIHIKHNGGGDIHEYVKPLPGETVFVKEHVSCFRETPLLEHLKQNEVERLVIVGMMTHMCVEAATRSADDLGFQTVLIHDACATRDLKYGDDVVAAKDVHLSTLSTLRAYANVQSSAEFLGE